MGNKRIIFQGAMVGAFVLLCIAFFRYFDSGHLFDKEQLTDSFCLSDTLPDCWGKPALLTCALSKTLLSLLLPVGGGAFLITAVFLLEWWGFTLILKRFHVGEMAIMYALVPVLLEWGTYCNPNYRFASILSLTIVLFIFYGYTFIKTKWLSMLTGLALLFIIYTLVGSRLFLFVIMVLMYEAEIGSKRWIYWTLLLVIGITLPEFMKDIYSLTEDQAYQYPNIWLPALFPSILVATMLVVTQLDAIRHMRAGVWPVSIMTGLLTLFLYITIFSHENC